MNKFLFASDPEKPRDFLIIKTTHPAVVGKVMKFRNQDELANFVAIKTATNGRCIRAQVDGYYILVVPYGTIGDMPSQYSDLWKHRNVLPEMATFFLENHISKKPRVYRDNKI